MLAKAAALAIPISLGICIFSAESIQKRAEANDWQQLRPAGRYYQLKSHSDHPPIHAVVRGKGSPCILLESSTGGLTQDWSSVIDDLAKISTVITYDRTGLGFSSGPECDPKIIQRPRNAKQISKELQDLLISIPEIDPSNGVILVGHGQGAASIVEVAHSLPVLRRTRTSTRTRTRRKSNRNSTDIENSFGNDLPCLAGVVLLDPVCGVQQSHKEISLETAAAINSLSAASKTLAKLAKYGVARIFMSLPNSIQNLTDLYLPRDCPTVQALSSRVTHRSTICDEVACYADDDQILHGVIQNALHSSSHLITEQGDTVPVLVVGHGNASMFKDLAIVGLEKGKAEDKQNRLKMLEELWQQGQLDLTHALSTSAVYMRGRDTEHHMPQKHARLTVNAIRAVLEAGNGRGGDGNGEDDGVREKSGGVEVLRKFKEKYHSERVIGIGR